MKNFNKSSIFSVISFLLLLNALPTVGMQRMLRLSSTMNVASSLRVAPRIFNQIRYVPRVQAPFSYSMPRIGIRTLIPQAPVLKTERQQKKDYDQKQQSFFNPINKKRLFAVGSVVAGLYAGNAIAQADEKQQEEFGQYKPPYEEQRKKYYAMLLSKPWGSVAKKYIDQFAQEEAEIMNKFFTYTKISKTEWEECKQKTLRPDFNNPFVCTFPARSVVVEEVKEVFNLLSIDSTKFKILEGSQTGLGFGILVVGNYLEPETVFFRTSILHEGQHLLHDDLYIHSCVGEILRKKKFNELTDKYGLKIQRFMERRADILAVLSDPSYAQVDAEKYKEWALEEPLGLGIPPKPPHMQTYGKRKKWLPPTHPTNTERAAYLQKVYEEMYETEKNQKLK